MTDQTQDKILQCIERHPDWKDRRIAQACRSKDRSVSVGEVRSLRPGGPDSIIIDEAEIFVPPDQIDLDELLERRRGEYERKEASELARKLIPVKIKGDKPIGIIHFGDPHVDDPGTDIVALERHVKIVNETPGMYAANIGDTTNNWVGRLTHLYGQQSVTAAEAWKLAEWLLSSCPWLYVIAGNHDSWSGAGDPLKWILRHTNNLYQSDSVRMGLTFSNKREVRINARHHWPGNSMWNAAHGEMKAAMTGFRDHILISGHTHRSGYGMVKCPATGVISHCIRIASYKKYDRYASERGFTDGHISPCAVTVIDPKASDVGLVTVFQEPEEAADYLTFKRSKK
jgi:hypothetical protein